MRKKVPDVPFQVLLRSANAVGYINYSSIMIHKFCKQASKYSVDVFRVFYYLSYT